jgi:oligopeptide transport system ATP-binding protein
MQTVSESLLNVYGLQKHFPITEGLLSRAIGYVRAVDGITFTVNQKETFGLVGESGCGKTTLGKCIIRLIEPTGGTVQFEGIDLRDLSRRELNRTRRNMQMVFQDPFSSLNPRMTVEQILVEPLIIHNVAEKNARKDRVIEALRAVGLGEEQMHRFPHEFSGGQRQRIAIARAIMLRPKLVVLDEPTSALDVSVRSQILNLLQELQKELGLTFLFISHDLGMIHHMSDRIAVMYAGKFVEVGATEEIFDSPLHPYTEALLSAIPIPNPERKKKKIILVGEVPSAVNPPSGCRFHPRCPYAFEQCSTLEPELVSTEKERFIACHLHSGKT